jgi:hypothetical protein
MLNVKEKSALGTGLRETRINSFPYPERNSLHHESGEPQRKPVLFPPRLGASVVKFFCGVLCAVADRGDALFEHIDGDVGLFFGDHQPRADPHRARSAA